MLDSITGEVLRKDATSVVLRTGGVAFRLDVPARTLDNLPDSGEVTLYSHLTVRDENLKLYGFESLFEREVFWKLTSVAGIGGAIALVILSGNTPAEVIEAVVSERHLIFQKAKGVGAKTAKRIVLELKGKVEEMGIAAGAEAAAGTTHSVSVGQDLLAALVTLGFSQNQARDAAARALADHPDEEDLEALIKSALASMGA